MKSPSFWALFEPNINLRSNKKIKKKRGKFIFSCELNKSRIAGGNYNLDLNYNKFKVKYISIINRWPTFKSEKNSETMDTWSMFYFVTWSFGCWFYNSRHSECAMCLWSKLYSKEIAALHKAWFFCQLKCPIIDDDLYRSWRFSWKLWRRHFRFACRTAFRTHAHSGFVHVLHAYIVLMLSKVSTPFWNQG